MSDLIDRQAAIDALEQLVIPEDMCVFEILSHIELVIGTLPSAQPEQRWIPCSERMPDEGQKCLVCDKGSIGIDTYIGHGNPYNWKWYTRDYEAWMPLPEPYKGGDE